MAVLYCTGMMNDVNHHEKIRVKLNRCRIPAGKLTLFKNFRFTWRAGERWGIIGPNGAGKSLLMRLIAGAIYSRSNLNPET